MRANRPEIIVGDPLQRSRWVTVVFSYLLLLLLFEPTLDQFLKVTVFEPTPEGVVALNEKKLLFATWGFVLLRSIPLLLFLWLGWQIVRSKRLPSPGLKLPFSVPLISGQRAQLVGMVMVAVALLSLLRELGVLLSVLNIPGKVMV